MKGSLTYQQTVELVLVECYSCAIVYGIPQMMETMLLSKREKASTYCPNGHVWHYVGQSDAEKLAAAKARLTATEDQLQAAERAAKRNRAEITRLRKRAENGVCPCCSRTFVQLARHMKAKHPEYATSELPG
jgi:hypothetical protein